MDREKGGERTNGREKTSLLAYYASIDAEGKLQIYCGTAESSQIVFSAA